TVRHNSDYDDFYLITKEETVQQIETAEQLLDAVEIYIEDKIRENKRK
ncbi:protein related to, partial [human gut metagenome]